MTRRVRPLAIAATAAIALLAVAGCAPASDEAVGESSQPSPSPSAEPSTSASDDGIDTSDWLEYSTHDGDMTYRYPADWTLESESVESSPEMGGRWFDDASLTAPNGQVLLQSSDFVDIGGACGEDDQFPIEVLASEPADVQPLVEGETPQITTVALGTADGRWTFGVGITSADRLPAPDSTGCGWYFVHGSSDGGVSIGTHFVMASGEDDPLWTVDTLDDAEAYMETEEYATLLEILRSVRTA
ncbi:hypothetical protein [Agrococcus sp. SGAir0287]|uniref:hypothetical protein n=1 Tax=Agrococcus sp. SGAir0287 TaxID=2070347 RepID=UPI0010F9E319|nr:hypothetical protein [Agrococcus sp. SGAir0287]